MQIEKCKLKNGMPLESRVFHSSICNLQFAIRIGLPFRARVPRAMALAGLLVTHLTEYARRCGTRRVAIRVQGDAVRLYASLIACGGRVRWTDLRMTMAQYAEQAQPADGVMLSNWEI